MTGHQKALLAGAALVLAIGSSSYVSAQPSGTPTPSGPPTPGGAPSPANAAAPEGTGLNLPTEAASLFARDRNISVTQRPHEGYEAKGLRMGGFLAYPKVSVTGEYNDNIYATERAPRSDVVWRINPEVNVMSNWSRHAIGFYARSVINRFQKYGSEDTTDYGVGANARLDILRNSNITTNVDWARLTEPRSSPNSPGVAAKPVRYDLTSVMLHGQHEINRLRLSGGYTYRDFSYSNPPKIGGGFVDQSFRDREIHSFTERGDYAISPDTAFFVEMDEDIRDYKHHSATDLRRDSRGLQALAGLNFELTALVRGEVAVGYLRQHFKDARLKNISGFGARGQLEWFPTQLTTVTLNATRTIEDSAVPGSGAYLSTNVGAQIDHELLRNVILTARGGYGTDVYKGINRKDERISAGLSGTYLLNRVLGITGGYSYDKNKSVRGVGNPYTDNKVSMGLTAQF